MNREYAIILIPYGSEILALRLEDFQAAKNLAMNLLGQPEEPLSVHNGRLLTAEEMSAQTGVPHSWFLEQARRNAIPHVRFGKYVRFRMDDVLEHSKFLSRQAQSSHD